MKANNILFITLFISIINLILSLNEENFNNDDTYGKDIDIDFSKEPNPYLILGVSQWTKFKDIKKRFKKIKEKMKLSNKLNSIEYKKYKTAFNQIEKIYKDNDYKDKSFLDILKITIKHIFIYEFFVFAALFLSWAIYKFNTFAALFVATSIFIDNIIPHWFSNIIFQYAFSFLIALIIYFRDYFLSSKKIEEEENENYSIDNNINGKKRKRFQKIE